MKPSFWPNAVTASRIALAPVMLGAAIAGNRGWFAGVFATALLTDVLDGFLARWLHAYSDFGRKLDSIADYVTLFTGLACLGLLWPDVVRNEWPWFAAVLGSFFVAQAFCFWRLGRAPCYHTWASKATVAGCVIALVPLLAGWTPVPARTVAVFQVLVGFEEMAIAVLVPWHTGEMPSVWHAWRRRRERERTQVES
jgi:phosphatidylglycerophosphate synthase